MVLWQTLIAIVVLFALILVLGLLSYRLLTGGEESPEEELSEWGLATLQLFGFSTTLYVAFYALVANLIVVFAGSALARVFVSQEQTSYGQLSEEDHREPEPV